MSTIAVMGDGAWGTALSLVLHGNGHNVRLWGAFPDDIAQVASRRENVKFLPGIKLPPDIAITSDAAQALDGADLVLLAAPAQFVRPVCQKITGLFDASVPVMTVAKGIENETNLRPSQVVAQMLNPAWVAVLSGPSHAEEVARNQPTIVAVASDNEEHAQFVQHLFMMDRFRVYTNNDLLGVELGGALKNVISLAAGMNDGLGLGDNAKSALITRGLAEMSRLGVAMGARRSTFSGLSGLGDLITTSISPHGRNRWAGEQMGKGIPPKQVIASTEKVIEGVYTVRSAHELAAQHNVTMPITEQLYEVVFNEKDPATAVADLMERLPRSEIE